MSSSAADDLCASRYADLNSTPQLSELKALFGPDRELRLVNQTAGSFLIVDGLNEDLHVRFYTSGLFDLYPVLRSGPVAFCQAGNQLIMRGLGREEPFVIEDRKVVLAGGGPKRVFATGEFPERLRKLHQVPHRGIASKP